MRISDQKLFDALEAVNLHELAARAALGEWNDYFGKHAMPQNHLLAELRIIQLTIAREMFTGYEPPQEANHLRIQAIQQVVNDVIDGAFDGTKEESAEWAASPEGQAMLVGLTKGKK